MWLKEIPSGLAVRSQRDPLIRSGLIAEDKRVPSDLSLGKRKLTCVSLEDKGWAWLADHMDASVWESKNAAAVLQSLLQHLSRFLRLRELVLADLMCVPPEKQRLEEATATTPAKVSRSSAADLSEQISHTYAQLSGHRSGARVRLSQLRLKLAHVSRRQLDETLERMSRAGVVVLNRLDNPAEIGEDDRAAEFITSIGEPRHIMQMEVPVHV
jgi:hypothetical protein